MASRSLRRRIRQRRQQIAVCLLLAVAVVSALLFSSAQTSVSADRSDWDLRLAWVASLDPAVPEPAELVRQREATDCGPAVLTMVLDHYGLGQLTREDVEALEPVAAGGTNMLVLKQIAEDRGLTARGLRLSLERLSDMPMPAVAHVFDNHFVLLRSVGTNVVVDDPSIGRLRMSPETFDRAWDGIILAFDATGPPGNLLQKGGS